MPIMPNLIERVMMLTLNRGPGPLLDFLGAQAFRAVCVAVKLGVFEALRDGPLTVTDIARCIQADQRGTTLLLEALEALGYLKKQRERYVNTRMTVKWLLRNSPTSLFGGIPFFESMVFERWGNLDQSIRQGSPAVHGNQWLEQHPGGWRIYQEGMVALAKMAADEIVAKVKLPTATRSLLDVGGGHALYSIAFCRRFSNLRATVVDVPQALEVAQETIAAEGMGARVTFRGCDFFTDDLGAGYDVALLFNVVHIYSPEKNAELLRKTAGALNVGGLIVILEQLTGKIAGPVAGALARLQGLNFFNDMGAQTYAFDEIAGWFTEACFTNLSRFRLFKMPGFHLVIGRKIKPSKELDVCHDANHSTQ